MKKNESIERLVIGQFFYDIVTSYRLAPHVADCALRIWDEAHQTAINKELRTETMAAAAFLLAQKWCDICVFSPQDIARLFHAPPTEIIEAECAMFFAFLSCKNLRCDNLLPAYLTTSERARVRSFFQMSVLGARPTQARSHAHYFVFLAIHTDGQQLNNEEHIESALHAANVQRLPEHSKLRKHAERIRSHTSGDLSVRFALLANITLLRKRR